jgi:hypothetical protein
MLSAIAMWGSGGKSKKKLCVKKIKDGAIHIFYLFTPFHIGAPFSTFPILPTISQLHPLT